MWQYLIPAGIQTTSSLLKYGTRKKTPSFANTSYGRYLRKLREEGKYSPEVRSRMLGQVSSQAGNVAQQERARTRGLLEYSNMGESIAGIRELNAPGLERMRTVAGAGERLGIENELSKQQAGLQYAQLDTASQMQRKQEAQQAIGDLIGGFEGAGMMGITEYLGNLEYEELLNIYKKLMGGGDYTGGLQMQQPYTSNIKSLGRWR